MLKFTRDRRRYLHWLFEAKKRFGLSVLNYMITSNHVHLLIKEHRFQRHRRQYGRTALMRSARDRQAFWEDRYHAAAIEADEHPYTHARGIPFKWFNRCALFKTSWDNRGSKSNVQ